MVKNLITKEFFDQQKLVLDIWKELNIIENILKSEGILNQWLRMPPD